MSIRIMNCVWELPVKPHTTKLVLLALADNANDQGVCWPSVGTLCRKCGLSDRGVQKILRIIQKEGWMTPTYASGKETIYTLTLPRQTPEPYSGVPPNGIRGRGEPYSGVKSPPPIGSPLREPSRTSEAGDPAIALLTEFRERFGLHPKKPNPKLTRRELEAANALLASTTANEIMDLAGAALRDKFAGNRRVASSLELIYNHLHELRAQFSILSAPKPQIERPWAEEKTQEQCDAEWAEYLALCAADGSKPDPKLRSFVEPKMPQERLGGIDTPSASKSLALPPAALKAQPS